MAVAFVSLCASSEGKLQLRAVTHRKSRTAAAFCGGAAFVFAIGLGVTGADELLNSTMGHSSIVVPAPPSSGAVTGGGGGALPARPAGGGACITGLNCDCIRNITCPKPRASHPDTANGQHTAPGPQNP